MWKKLMIAGVVDMLRTLLKQNFKNSEFLAYELKALDRLRDVVGIVTDDDKDNSAQLDAYILANQAEFGKHIGELIKDLTDKDKKSSYTD